MDKPDLTLEVAIRTIRHHREAQKKLLESLSSLSNAYGKGVIDGIDTALAILEAMRAHAPVKSSS